MNIYTHETILALPPTWVQSSDFALLGVSCDDEITELHNSLDEITVIIALFIDVSYYLLAITVCKDH